MLRRFKSRTIVALTAVAALAIAGAAYAYLTSTGGGTGSGNVTASSTALNITFTQPDFTVLPQSKTVAIYATNSGSSVEYFKSLTSFSVSSTDSTKCPTGSFVAGTPSTTAQEIPADGLPHQIGTVSVTFTDLTTQAQDGCIGTGTASYAAQSN